MRFPVSELHLIKLEAEERAKRELAIPRDCKQLDEWALLQSGQISVFCAPLQLPLDESTKKVKLDILEAMSDQYHHLISLAFGHTCMTTPFDDFIYIMSMKPAERETKNGYMAFDLSIICHITAFIWAIEQLFARFIEMRTNELSKVFRCLPGDQHLEVHPHFDELVPHRITRTGANRISVQHLADRPIPMQNGASTSVLLRILSVILLKPDFVIWDEADSCPDWEKVMSMVARISDLNRFSWNHVQLMRTNPEQWEYVGDRDS